MYFAFILVTAKAIATLAAVAVTTVLIVKRLSNLRRGTNRDSESPQHADKNSVPASGAEQEAHENLEEKQQGLHEELEKKGEKHEELDPKEEDTEKELEEKERSSRWNVQGKEQPS